MTTIIFSGVIVEDADHSLLAMAGLSDTEDTFSSISRTAPRRAVWLGVNLITAIIASTAISLFEGTLDKVVALAILMPIVAHRCQHGRCGRQSDIDCRYSRHGSGSG